MTSKLIPITSKSDVPPQYQDTPIGRLLEYHNLGLQNGSYSEAELLVGMCIDNRKQLNIPENFAFIIRAGGANLKYSEFKVSYAIGIGGIQHLALIGHNHCGMSDLTSKKTQFINGLVKNAGWSHEAAEKHFHHYSPLYEIGDEIDFTFSEARRLRLKYPKITVAPLIYRIEDNLLYLIKDDLTDKSH